MEPAQEKVGRKKTPRQSNNPQLQLRRSPRNPKRFAAMNKEEQQQVIYNSKRSKLKQPSELFSNKYELDGENDEPME